MSSSAVLRFKFAMLGGAGGNVGLIVGGTGRLELAVDTALAFVFDFLDGILVQGVSRKNVYFGLPMC